MLKKTLAYVFTLLLVIGLAPMALGSADAAPDVETAETAEQATEETFEDTAEMQPLFLDGREGASGTMSSNGQVNGLMACEWYSIQCNDGTTDECCGSESSCLQYCAEVCGGPCSGPSAN